MPARLVFRSHPAFGTSSGLRAIGPREGLDATWQEVAAKAAVQGLDTLVLDQSVLLRQPPRPACVAKLFASTCCGVCIAAKSWTCSPGTRCCRMEVHQQALDMLTAPPTPRLQRTYHAPAGRFLVIPKAHGASLSQGLAHGRQHTACANFCCNKRKSPQLASMRRAMISTPG